MCESLLAWHMLLGQSAMCNKVWEGWESIGWKSSKRFRTPQWMWGYLCFTSHCSHTHQSCCGLLFLHQSLSSFFLALIMVFFSLWHRDNKTASTSTTPGKINLYNVNTFFASGFLVGDVVNKWKIYQMQLRWVQDTVLPLLTHYTLNFIFYKSFWGYRYLAWAVPSLLLWASTGNFS